MTEKNLFFRHLFVWPFIWALLIPIILLDLFTELYHRIAFPLCGIPLVKRSQYIRLDRHKLSYLGLGARIGCMYCGYANGFINYASEIAGRTERYWCAIKHQKIKGFKPPQHHKDFAAYGSGKDPSVKRQYDK